MVRHHKPLVIAPAILAGVLWIIAAKADASVVVFNNDFSTSAPGSYTNGQAINSGTLTSQLEVATNNAGMESSVINPGASFTDGPALDLTNNGNGTSDGYLANRLGDGNSAWNQLSSGSSGNNLVTAGFVFTKLQSTGGFRFFLGYGGDQSSSSTQVVRIEITPSGFLQGNIVGTTDPGYTISTGVQYKIVVTLDLNSTTQHTYSYTLYNLATNVPLYYSGPLPTRNATAVPDRVILDWGVVAESSVNSSPFIELGVVGISAGNEASVVNNNFSSSTTGTYANAAAINSGTSTAQLEVSTSNAGMIAAIVNPGLSFTTGPALDLTNDGNGSSDGYVANRLGDGNSQWNQLSSGAAGNNLVTATFSFTKLQSTGGFRFFLGYGGDTTSSSTQIVRIEITPTGFIQGNIVGTTDAGYTLSVGTAYKLIVTLDLSSTTQHTYTYTLYNASSGVEVYTSGPLPTRNATGVPDRLVMDWGVVAESSVSTSAFMEIGNVAIAASPMPQPIVRTGVLWRIGLNDGSSSEFTGTIMPTSYTVPSNWSTQTTWPQWPSTNVSSNWQTDISFTLASVPAGGAYFTFQAANAMHLVPELAVFSNGNPCGIIQIGGDESLGWGAYSFTRLFRQPYRIYIPPQFLQAGTNTLHLWRLGHPYCTSTSNVFYMDFAIDFMEADSLSAPPLDPTHSQIVHIGISEGDFYFGNGDTTDPADGIANAAQPLAEWLGVAYSGNPQRVCYWSNNSGELVLSHQLTYLNTLKSLDMSVILDGLSCGNTTDSEIVAGQLPSADQSYLNTFFSNFGSLAQFYEICNEPCQGFTNASYLYCKTLAGYVNSIKPSTMTLEAPGYAFGGGSGSPTNWDADNSTGNSNRNALDALCGAYGGHSFGSPGWGFDGGDLAATIDADGMQVGGVGEFTDGFDKLFVNTECGASDTSFENISQIPSNRPYTTALDRNLRANVGFADYFCFADVFNNNIYNMLDGAYYTPSSWIAHPCGGYKPLVTTAAASAGATTITCTNASTLVSAGAILSGTGIPSGAIVSSVSGTTVTLSSPVVSPGVSNGESITVYSNGSAQEPVTKLQVFRRLALAYGTHGSPLSYTYSGISSGTYPLIYFRGVNTATLPALPGSGATSNKILLSFVNFDYVNSNTVNVTVTMPSTGTFTGVCYGPGNTIAASKSSVSLTTASNATLTFSVTLPAGESTEYILNPAH